MKALVQTTRQFEFSLPNLDTLVLVEELDDKVTIRATKNSFSEPRKVQFIRELAAEGFISESYQSFTGLIEETWLHVRWLVDASWLKLRAASTARTRRFLISVLSYFMIGLMVCAALMRLGLIITQFVH